MSRMGQMQMVSEHMCVFGWICLLVGIDIDLQFQFERHH